MYERVLVPLDGLPLAEEILPHIEELGAKFNSEFILIRVVPSLTELIRDILPQGGLQTGGASADLSLQVATREHDENQTTALEYLEKMADRFRARQMKVRCLVREGAAGRAIVTAAHETGAGLIAMSTHSRRGLTRSVLGSVAEEVVRQSHLPVLLIHP